MFARAYREGPKPPACLPGCRIDVLGRLSELFIPLSPLLSLVSGLHISLLGQVALLVQGMSILQEFLKSNRTIVSWQDNILVQVILMSRSEICV